MAKNARRAGQLSGEPPLEYLSRAVSNLEHERCGLLDQLPTVEAALDFFDLWHIYDTDLWTGVLEQISEGADVTPALDFVKKHKLPNAWREDILDAKQQLQES